MFGAERKRRFAGADRPAGSPRWGLRQGGALLAGLLFLGAAPLRAMPRVIDTVRLSAEKTLDHPVPILADPEDGSLYVGGYYSGNIIKYDPVSRRVLGEITGVNAPLDFYVSEGKLYVYGFDSYWRSSIFVYDAHTLALLETVLSDWAGILSFDVDGAGHALYTGGWGRVYKVNLETYQSELFCDLGKPAYSYAVSSIKVDAARRRLYLVGYDYGGGANADFINVDMETGAVLATVPIGTNPVRYDIRYDSDQDGERLFVTQMYSSSVTVVNVVSNAVEKDIAGVSWPQRLVSDPARHRLYVVDNYTDKFHVLDTQTLELVKSFSPGDDPSGVCLDAARNRIYTANVWTQDVSVIDRLQEKLIDNISFAPATPLDVAVDPAEGVAYVTNGPNGGIFRLDAGSHKVLDRMNAYRLADMGYAEIPSGILNVFTGEFEFFTPAAGGNRLGAALDPFNRAVALFDLTERTYLKEITPEGEPTALASYDGKLYYPYVSGPDLYLGWSDGTNSGSFPIGPSDGAQGIAIDAGRKEAYIADYANGQLVVFDLAGAKVSRRIGVESFPAQVAVDSAAGLVYVTNYGADSVSVIDAASGSLAARIGVGAKPWGIRIFPAARRGYVVNSEAGTLSVFDSKKRTIVATLPVVGGAKYCALDEGAMKLYVPAQSSGTVTVIEDKVDVTPPAIDCPAPIVLETASASGEAVAFATPSVRDDEDLHPTVSVSPVSGSVFPVGISTVVVRAEDASGNAAQCSFTVKLIYKECPQPVRDLAALPLSGLKILLSWSPSPTTGIAAYRVYSGIEAVDYSRPAAELSAQTTSWTASGLKDGTNYKFVVRALHGSGCEEANTNVVSATAFERPPCLSAKVTAPQNGRKVSGERLTVMAETLCEESKEVKSVRFEYRPAAESGWRLIPAANKEHPNPDAERPYFVHWNVSALLDGEYQIRAVAVGAGGLEDAAPAFITLRVDHADPDSAEREEGNGRVEKVEKIENQRTNSVVVSARELSAPAKVEIPPGALSQKETKVTVKLNPENAPGADAQLKSAGTKIEIALESGQHVLEDEATITLPYPDEDSDGVVDGMGIPAKDLGIYYFNTGKGSWERLKGCRVDGAHKQVSAKTDHFSLFGLFAAESNADGTFRLGEVYVFPNPAKGGRNPTLHVEAGIAERVELRFYDLAGELVHSVVLTEPPAVIEGRYAYEYGWDTRETASGIYLISVSAYKNGESTLKKNVKAAVVK